MGDSLISVVVPIYNVEPYLRRCVDSIIGQSYSNLEVILVDDGSPDQSGLICDEYAEKDARIKVIHKPNGGISAARNSGLDIATGEYIGFVDSDDWLPLEYFEILMKVAQNTGAEVVACKYMRVKDDDSVPRASRECKYDVIDDPFSRNVDGVVKRVVHSKLFSSKSVYDIRFTAGLTWGEDTDFCYKVFSRLLGEKNGTGHCAIVFIPQEMYYYYQRSSSITHALDTMKKVDIIYQLLSYVNIEENAFDTRKSYLSQACKQILSTRHEGKFSANKQFTEECKNLFKQSRNFQKKYKLIGKAEWFLLNLFYLQPWLYRLYRIIDDPTLLVWEKNQKSLKRGKCEQQNDDW